MKKNLFFVVLGVIALSFLGCGGGGKYGDAVSVFSDITSAYKGFFGNVEKANSADDVVKAIEDLSATMSTIAPKMKALKDKYPELDKMKEEEIPTELKDAIKKMTEEMSQFMKPDSAFAKKMQQFATDPKVMEAQKKLVEAMSSLGN